MIRPQPIDCALAADLASEEFAARRDDGSRLALAEHLGTCAACRAVFAPELRLWSALATIPRSPYAAPTFVPRRSPHRVLRRVAAALLLVAGGFIALRFGACTPKPSAKSRPVAEAVVLLRDPSEPAAPPVFIQSFVVVRREGRRTSVRENSRTAALASIDAR